MTETQEADPQEADHPRKPLGWVMVMLLCLECLLFPIASVVILFVFIFSTKPFLALVNSKPEVRHPPYSPYIWTSAVAPIAVSSIALTWAVLLFYPQFKLATKPSYKKYWWAAVTTFRLCIVVVLIAIAVASAQYMPLPLGSCEHEHEWRPGSNVPPNTPTVFDVLPRGWRKGTGKGRHRWYYESGCTRLAQIWKLDIAIATLYFVMACVSAYLWARAQGISWRRWSFKTKRETQYHPVN